MTPPEVDASRIAASEKAWIRHPAPDNVESLRALLLVETGLFPDQGSPSVGTDYKVAAQVPFASLRHEPYANHAPLLPQKRSRAHTALEAEGREVSSFVHQHLEHGRLRYGPRQYAADLPLEVYSAKELAVSVELDTLTLSLGQRVQSGKKAHLLEGVDPAGLEYLATELPREIGMTFHQRDHASSCQKIGEGGSRWSCPDDHDVSHMPFEGAYLITNVCFRSFTDRPSNARPLGGRVLQRSASAALGKSRHNSPKCASTSKFMAST